jgi:hypothetical protein
MEMSTTALVRPERRRPTYVRRVILHPVSLSVAALATCSGVALGGALSAALVFPLVLAAVFGASRLGPMRRTIEGWIAATERRDRERDRIARLEAVATARRAQYDVLADLVQDSEQADPAQAARFGLEDLLDDFVRIADLLERRQRAACAVGALPGPRTASGRTRAGSAADVVTRRIRLTARCAREREMLLNRLDAIEQLIRLIACHIACPALDGDYERAIDRRLEDLDALDEAFVEVGDVDAQ